MQSKYVMKYVCEFLWLKLEVRIECLLILKLEVRIECLLIPLSRGSLYYKSRHLWCSFILGCVLMFVLGHLYAENCTIWWHFCTCILSEGFKGRNIGHKVARILGLNDGCMHEKVNLMVEIILNQMKDESNSPNCKYFVKWSQTWTCNAKRLTWWLK